MKLPYEFVETEPHEKGFADFYKKAIVPLAEKHNDEFNRRWYVNLFNKSLAVTSEIVLTLVTIKYLFFANSLPKAMAALGANAYFPPFISWWLLVHRTNKEYFSAIKQEVIPVILKFKGEFAYYTNRKFPVEELNNYNLFSKEDFSTAKCDDFIEYKDDQILLRIFENIKWSFRGPSYTYLTFEYPYNFPGEAIIYSKKLKKQHEKRILKYLSIHNKKNYKDNFSPTDDLSISQLKRKKDSVYKAFKERSFLQDTYNDLFYIFSNNEEVEKLFCNEFIEYLTYIGYLFEDDGLILSVKKNYLVIEIPTKIDLFEIVTDYDTPLLNAIGIKWLLKELYLAIETVDMINSIIKRNSENIKHAAE